jgi:hypothetical protein
VSGVGEVGREEALVGAAAGVEDADDAHGLVGRQLRREARRSRLAEADAEPGRSAERDVRVAAAVAEAFRHARRAGARPDERDLERDLATQTSRGLRLRQLASIAIAASSPSRRRSRCNAIFDAAWALSPSRSGQSENSTLVAATCWLPQATTNCSSSSGFRAALPRTASAVPPTSTSKRPSVLTRIGHGQAAISGRAASRRRAPITPRTNSTSISTPAIVGLRATRCASGALEGRHRGGGLAALDQHLSFLHRDRAIQRSG